MWDVIKPSHSKLLRKCVAAENVRKLFGSAVDQVNRGGKVVRIAARTNRPEENAGGRCGWCVMVRVDRHMPAKG